MSGEKRGEELAHGYLVAGDVADVPRVHAFLKAHGIEVSGNPDVFFREYKSFGIDDARALRERAMTRAVVSSRRVFILVTPSMTTESQNALLKTLEEPLAGAVFFFVVPAPMSLLATLRSRMQVFVGAPALGGRSPGRSIVDVNLFLVAPIQKRLDMLKPLYMKDEEDERDIRHAISFLTELEYALADRTHAGSREGLLALYRARRYINDKGSLLKLLLEQVALLTPHSV